MNDLRDKSLLTLNADKVSRVELLKKPEEIEFDRTKDGWQILKPKPSPADSFAVNDLVRSLTEREDGSQRSKRCRGGICAGYRSGDRKVNRRRRRADTRSAQKQDDYYAKSSAVEGTYKVDSAVGQALDKKIDDFKKKEPLAPAPAASES